MFNCCNCPCTLLRNNPFKLFSCPVNVWYVHCTLHSQVLGIRIFFDQTRIQLLKNMQLVTIYTLINIEIKYMLYNVLCCIIFCSLVLQNIVQLLWKTPTFRMTSHFSALWFPEDSHNPCDVTVCCSSVYDKTFKRSFHLGKFIFQVRIGFMKHL